MARAMVTEARTDAEWEQALAVMHATYVGEGYTNAATAAQFMTRAMLGSAGRMLIVKDGTGAVCGATVYLHADGPLRQIARDGEREFRMLAVRSDARGAGAGKALVQACIDRSVADGVDALVLWTQPSMHAAQRLYARLGFQRAPERDMPDPRGWTRLVFVRLC